MLCCAFQLILAVGNFLNEGTNRGNCVGFDLAFLLDVRAVKVTNAATDIKHLLHLLVDISHREDGHGIVESLDCEHIEAATRIAVKQVFAQLKVLQNSLHDIEVEVSKIVKAAQENETRFGLNMKVFANNAKSELRVITNAASELETQLDQVGQVFL